MGRAVRISFLVIALGCVFGCGGGSSNNNNNGSTQMLSTFTGEYAFEVTGFDAGGHPLAMAGAMTADGQGHVTASSIDVNDNFVVSSGTSVPGSYTLDTTLRGVITFTNTFGSIAHPLVFAFTLKTNGAAGNIMSLDSNPFTVAGTIQQQTTSAFSLSSMAADYAFELDSNAGTRQSTIGRFTLSSGGGTSSTLLDTSVAGTGPTTNVTTGTSFSLTFNSPGSNGRGTATMSQGSGQSAQPTSYVYYIVAAGKMLILQTDASNVSSTIRAGNATKQNGPFTTVSVNTGGAVFALAGINAANDVSAIGNLAITGQNSANLTWDINDNGDNGDFSKNPHSATNQTVVFDQTMGRGKITIPSGFTNGLFDSAIFYLTAPGQGYVLDTSAGANNRALAGSLTPQVGEGTFSSATLSGNMLVHAVANSTTDSGSVVGTFVPSGSTFTLTFDRRSVGQADGLNLVSTGDTVSDISATTGRGTLNLGGTTGVGSQTKEIFYLIGPNQFVFVDETAPPSTSNPPPPTPLIFFFDPQ